MASWEIRIDSSSGKSIRICEQSAPDSKSSPIVALDGDHDAGQSRADQDLAHVSPQTAGFTIAGAA